MARGFLGRNCKFQIRQKETKKTALRECDLIILVYKFYQKNNKIFRQELFVILD